MKLDEDDLADMQAELEALASPPRATHPTHGIQGVGGVVWGGVTYTNSQPAQPATVSKQPVAVSNSRSMGDKMWMGKAPPGHQLPQQHIEQDHQAIQRPEPVVSAQELKDVRNKKVLADAREARRNLENAMHAEENGDPVNPAWLADHRILGGDAGGAIVKLPLSGTVVDVGDDAVRKMSPQQAYQKGYAEATGHTVPVLDVWGTRLNPKCSAGVSPKQVFSSPSEEAYSRGLALAMAGDSTASSVPALSPVPYDISSPQIPVNVTSSPPQSEAFQAASVVQQQAPTQGDDSLGNVYYSHQAAQLPS